MGEVRVINPEGYADKIVEALDKRVDTRIVSLEKRLDGRCDDLGKDIEHMNGGSLMPRTEFNLAHCKVEEAISKLQTFKDAQEGKASQGQVYVAWILTALSLALSAFAIFR